MRTMVKIEEAAPVIHTHPHARQCRHCGLVNGGNAVMCVDCNEPLRVARNTASIEGMATEQFRIPNGTSIDFPNGWTGIVIDQSGPDVQVTYGNSDGTYLGVTKIDRDRIEHRKVVR